MHEYKKVFPSHWTDAAAYAARKAGTVAQTVRLYVMTAPHSNSLGIYRLPPAYAAADLGMQPKDFEGALKLLEDAGYLRFDRESDVVWIIEFANEQIGELHFSKKQGSLGIPDRRIIGLRNEFSLVPDCALKQEFLKKYNALLKLNSTAENTNPRPSAVSTSAA